MGWITVVVIIASLLATSVYLVRKGAQRWWDYLAIVILTAVLVRPVLKTSPKTLPGREMELLSAGPLSPKASGL